MKVKIKQKAKKLLPPKFNHPYDRFQNTELIIRDYLAIQRTNLANERTLLAYINCAIALLVVGVSFIKFLNSFILKASGITFCGLAVVALIIGVINYYRRKKQIPQIKNMHGEEYVTIKEKLEEN